MSYFRGKHSCKLDAKGRLALPAKVKSALPESTGNKLFIGHGFEPCLVLYPVVEYKKKESQILGLDDYDPENRRLKRSFFENHYDMELDSANRFLISKGDLAYAKLEKEVLLIGLGDKIEVWSPEVYEAYTTGSAEEYSKLVQKKLSEE